MVHFWKFFWRSDVLRRFTGRASNVKTEKYKKSLQILAPQLCHNTFSKSFSLCILATKPRRVHSAKKIWQILFCSKVERFEINSHFLQKHIFSENSYFQNEETTVNRAVILLVTLVRVIFQIWISWISTKKVVWSCWCSNTSINPTLKKWKVKNCMSFGFMLVWEDTSMC